MSEEQDVNEQKRGLTSQIGPLEIDWPRTIGYYGGIGLAVAFELVEPLLAIFIAAIPLLKMLNHPKASAPTRFVGELPDGAAKPVGGSAEATIQLKSDAVPATRRLTILQEARQLASQVKHGRAGTTSRTDVSQVTFRFSLRKRLLDRLNVPACLSSCPF